MHRTRVKICGITRPEDAAAAATAGADAIGIVLHAKSKRCIPVEDAKAVRKAVPPFVSTIGLFVDAKAETIITAASALSLSMVQLHGGEGPDLIEALDPIPVIKVVHVTAATLGNDLKLWRDLISEGRVPNLFGLLLDAAAGGGTGVSNDWDTLHKHLMAGELREIPVWIAAGGLNPKNVTEVVHRLHPWAVDVASGVEVRPGEKSRELIGEFIQAVRHADSGR
jgi:phosphoribosylanthranilate isomerase